MTVLSKDEYQAKYNIKTSYVEDMAAWFKARAAKKVFLNDGINCDSDIANLIPEEKHLLAIEGSEIVKGVLYEILANTRVTKTEQEIEVMRWASRCTVEGHIEVMRRCKGGLRESDLESIFKHYSEMKYKCYR